MTLYGVICVKSPGGNGNDTFLWGTTVFASVRCRRGINLGRSFTMGSRSNMAGEGCRHINSRASEMRALCYADGIPPTRCACPTATWESTRRTRSVRSSACATRVPRVPDARHRLRILTTRLVNAGGDGTGAARSTAPTDDMPCDNVIEEDWTPAMEASFQEV